MIESLGEIKKLRKKLGIGQKELAKLAGVSQSLIAKIESNKIEPTYIKVKKIFNALIALDGKEEVKAKEVMNKKVIFANHKDKIKQIIKKMKQKGISQMPVLKDGKVRGIINEKIILEKIAEGKQVRDMTAVEIMEDCPPIISQETSRKIILGIIQAYSVVLVAEMGDIVGLISKSDVLETI
jgi:predicted transcriptional regulator